MAAPTRGNEVTLVADGTTVTNTNEQAVAWDASGAFFGSMNIKAKIASGNGYIYIYQCDSEAGSDEYPARAEGTLLGSFYLGATDLVKNFKVYQAKTTIRIYNASGQTLTLTTVRGRLYT